MVYNDITQLLNKTFHTISAEEESITFLNDEIKVVIYHQQDCCESVYLEDINGDLTDLQNSPIILAEERTNSEDTMGRQMNESFTWTFYTIGTRKGYVVFRFLGESNGYYSESCTIELTKLTEL